ncbi:MFS transporter [Phyllobacterium lublinensis]|uniref:MFS transporter n=1 Tax=Phyllobacterium lublinensis TaxID=2875708 RepID=UPI001CCF92B5|nr:MFS transporter [Phyllobacterium sp. 2063]MBZ9653711.1 MHS family MFS transporter [Phyllobacterium sp. 2063]
MHQPIAGVKAPGKAALASWIGSAVEYYDFFIYGTAAALIFPKIFFSAANPQAAAIASFATFGVAYIARPFGAVILGHVGDKFGRKKVLTFTLLLMGISTFLIGCLPTYDHVGILAPVLLVIARLLQGISAAGEQAGANSMTLEHAPPHRRAFFTSFTLSGTQAGLILATLVFIPISKLPEADLLSWGWRIPFFLSLAVVAVGFWVRRSLPETPVFLEETNRHETAKVPFVLLFTNHWADVLRIIFAALISVVSTIFSVFTLSYAVNTMQIDRSTMLTVLVLANLVALGAIPLWASLADRIGRKPIFITGALGCAVLIWPYIWAISQGNLPLIFVLGILLSGIVYSASNGVWPALYGEMFDTRVRLSGMAIGTQIGFALGGFAPTISAALLGTGPMGWVPVAAFTSVTATIAAISAATASETYRTPMHDLGKKLVAVPA